MLNEALARVFVECDCRDICAAGVVRHTHHLKVSLQQAVLTRRAVDHDECHIKLHLYTLMHKREITLVYLHGCARSCRHLGFSSLPGTKCLQASLRQIILHSIT